MPFRPPAGFISAFYDPLKNPNTPFVGTASAGSTTASVPVTAPNNVGGSAVSLYGAVSTPGSLAGTSSTSPVTVTGLTNGTAYTFRAWVQNSFGPSAYSASTNSVTPVTGFLKTSLSLTVAPTARGFGVDPSGNSALLLRYQTNTGGNYYSGYIFNATSGSGAQLYAVNRNGLDPLCCGSPYTQNQPRDIVFDSSGNSYVAMTENTFAGTPRTNVSAFSSSGTLLWQRQLTTPSQQDYVNAGSICVDSSANVFIVNGGNGSKGLLAKYNSSGVLQWKKALTNFNSWSGITTDSSGNIYICGYSTTGFAPYGGIAVAKFDSTGAVLAQTSFGGGSTQSFGLGISVASSGDIYVGGNYNSGGGTIQSVLVKLNSSLVIQWANTLGGALGGFGKPAFDSSGNVYVSCGYTVGHFLAKYNSSGTLQFQRSMSINLTSVYTTTATYVLGNSVYFGTSTNTSVGGGGYGGASYAVPTDGTSTGTYTVGGRTIIYAASSQTSASVTLTTSTPNLTSTTDTAVTDAAGSFSQYAAFSTTNSVVTL